MLLPGLSVEAADGSGVGGGGEICALLSLMSVSALVLGVCLWFRRCWRCLW
jgi:hypothetical protein